MKILPGIWTSFLRKTVLPAGDFLFGQRMIERLNFLETAQRQSPEKIKIERLRLLQELVRVSYGEVKFYKELMDRAGVRPENIKTIEDLKKIPIVTKAMVRQAYPDKMLRDTGQRIYESRTSGSTGENFSVMEDAFTAGWYRASFLLSLEWAGWKIGEPHLQTGITPDRGVQKKIKDILLGAFYFSAFDLTDAHLDRMLNVLEQKKIQHLWGYPGGLYYLARRAASRKWSRPLKSIVTWGDALYPQYRSEIEKVFGAKIFDTYGCSEGMQIAAQCEHGNYHLHDLDVIVEFVDDEGREVPEETEGNLIVTRLHPGPMPLIRYRIGDRGIRGRQKSCVCGRGFQTMESLRGRETDAVITPSGNRLIVHFFTGIFEYFSAIRSFQVVQETAENVRIYIAAGQEDRSSLEIAVHKALKEKGLTGMNVKIDFVHEIPLKAGKRRFIINQHFSRTGETNE